MSDHHDHPHEHDQDHHDDHDHDHLHDHGHDHGHHPKPKIRFTEFLDRFHEVEWPAVLTEESYVEFSRRSKPLPQLLIEAFIAPFEGIDETTEFIPCLKWAISKDITAVVYWKAELLNYQYILGVYNNEGFQIDRQVIAGSGYSDEQVLRRVATISSDRIVHILEGAEDLKSGSFDPVDTDRYQLEIADDGEIIFSLMKDTE